MLFFIHHMIHGSENSIEKKNFCNQSPFLLTHTYFHIYGTNGTWSWYVYLCAFLIVNDQFRHKYFILVWHGDMEKNVEWINKKYKQHRLQKKKMAQEMMMMMKKKRKKLNEEKKEKRKRFLTWKRLVSFYRSNWNKKWIDLSSVLLCMRPTHDDVYVEKA